MLTAVIIAGRVGSAFAAEIGTMKVTEQIDALQILKTDPIDYLVIPRVIACALMLPLLNILSFITGMTGGLIIASSQYGIPYSVFLESAQNFLSIWDLVSSLVKAFFFGILIAVIGTNWGLTTTGGAKGVGQSTTTAVVTALLAIFISNFFPVLADVPRYRQRRNEQLLGRGQLPTCSPERWFLYSRRGASKNCRYPDGGDPLPSPGALHRPCAGGSMILRNALIQTGSIQRYLPQACDFF